VTAFFAGQEVVADDYDDLINPARTGCRVRRVANQSISNITSTPISFDQEDQDTDGFITVTGSTVTIPAGLDGIYAILFRASGSFTNVRNFAEIGVTSSLTGVPADFRVPWNEPTDENRLGVFLGGLPLAAGDSFVCNIFQSSGGALNVTAWMSCYRVSI